jgi:septal ring factor EnvC (AmiA/AmiB activator)
MEFELQGWKVRLALGALVLVVVAAPFVRAVYTNRGRAEGWHRRAVVAEESVTGLRVVIVERSRALNRRTVQANQLVSELHSTRAALRRSKVNVGTLTRRQRELANENARIETERRKLQTRQAALETIASKLGACAKSLDGAQGKRRRTIAASAPSTLATCRRLGASLDAYLEQLR